MIDHLWYEPLETYIALLRSLNYVVIWEDDTMEPSLWYEGHMIGCQSAWEHVVFVATLRQLWNGLREARHQLDVIRH